MRITTLSVGPLQTNCYIISNQKGECIIVDPGEDGVYIAEKINELELVPLAMFATHGHHDHTGGATTLKMIYGITLYIDPEDISILKRGRSTSMHFSKLDTGPTTWDITKIKGDSHTKISDFIIQIIQLPGHTKGGLGFVIEDNLFSGDILFADGSRGESSHSYSDPIKLSHSVSKVLSFKGRIWPGHGESFGPEEIPLTQND